MKHFITFLAVVICTLVSFTSCNKEKKLIEDQLVSQLKSPSSYKFISFEEVETITLGDELTDRIEVFSEQVSEFSKLANNAKSHNEEFACKYWEEEYKNWNSKANKSKQVLSYLTNLQNTEDINQITFRIYKIIFEASNSFGAIERSVCYGRISNNNELVAIKVDNGTWNFCGSGKFFSIPKYYEII